MLYRSPLTFSVSLSIMFLACFFLTLLLGAFLLQVGIQSGYIGLLMLSFLMGTYIFTGIFTKTMRFSAFTVAERAASPLVAGQGIASGIISSGIFIALSGNIYEGGTDALAAYAGWILGACLMVVLFAAAVNRSDKATITSYLHADNRYPLFRGLTLFVATLVCGLLLIAQFRLAAILGETFLGIDGSESITLMAIAIGSCLILGGMQGLSQARMLAYPIIAIGFLLPISMIAFKLTGNPFPQLAYGSGALEPIMQIDREIIDTGFAESNEIFSLTKSRTPDALQYLAVLFGLACGLAAMPHLLQHFTTTRQTSHARRAGVWGIGLVLLVLTAIPAFAAFYRIDIYTSLLGLQLADLEGEASWIFGASGASNFNAISICGEYVTNLADAMAACGQGADYFLTSQDIAVNPSLLVLSSGILNALPPMITWLLATGAIIAIWSTADGIALALANNLSQDGYGSLIRPDAPKSMRLFVNRFVLVMALLIASALTAWVRPDPVLLFEASFSYSAACLFPALLTRTWWRTTSNSSHFAGIASGFTTSSILLFFSIIGPDFQTFSGDELRLALNDQISRPTLMTCGVLGMIAAFTAIWINETLLRRRRRKAISKPKEDTDVSARPETV